MSELSLRQFLTTRGYDPQAGVRRLLSGRDSLRYLMTRIRGFVDTHNHQFAYLGFGGKAFVGKAFGTIDQALPHCDFLPGCPDPGNNPYCTVHGPGGIRDQLGSLLGLSYHSQGFPWLGGHLVGGNPEFDGWPRWNSIDHQAVYQDWLLRALQGGLKLLVVLAVNSEWACGHVDTAPGRTCDDMEAVDLQLAEARKMQNYVDSTSGGPGKGWYRIVTTPREARDVISAGKLAVVLGIEVDYLFGSKPGSLLSPFALANAVQYYYSRGVRHIFPIHFADNLFGGAAFQNAMKFDPTQPQPGPVNPEDPFGDLTIPVYPEITSDCSGQGYTYRTGRCNVLGLTDLGKNLIQLLMDRAMIIDIDHMSAQAKNDTFTIAEANNYYPVVCGHTGFVEISRGDRCNEGNLRKDEIDSVQKLGGMISVITDQGDFDQTNPWSNKIQYTCGNTTESWAQAYLYAIDKMKGRPVGFGTDFMGGIIQPGPRFGPEACPGGRPDASVTEPPPGITYPFTAVATGVAMYPSVVGNKTFNFNQVGLAHIGLLPDFIADLQQLGLTLEQLNPLLNSAEGYIQVWEKVDTLGTIVQP